MKMYLNETLLLKKTVIAAGCALSLSNKYTGRKLFTVRSQMLFFALLFTSIAINIYTQFFVSSSTNRQLFSNTL